MENINKIQGKLAWGLAALPPHFRFVSDTQNTQNTLAGAYFMLASGGEDATMELALLTKPSPSWTIPALSTKTVG